MALEAGAGLNLAGHNTGRAVPRALIIHLTLSKLHAVRVPLLTTLQIKRQRLGD